MGAQEPNGRVSTTACRLRGNCWVTVLLLLVLLGCAASRIPDALAGWRCTAAGGGDALALSARGDTIVLDVHSNKGIGSAQVERPAVSHPRGLVLRFHLRGLEELRFEYDPTTVLVSLSGTVPPAIRRELHRSGSPILPVTDPASPYWMEIRVGTAGAPGAALPSAGGVIEVTAPPHFLQGGRRSCTLRWIDFLR